MTELSPVGLAVARGDSVEVRVVDASSALTDGRVTGETAIIKKVSETRNIQNTGINQFN